MSSEESPQRSLSPAAVLADCKNRSSEVTWQSDGPKTRKGGPDKFCKFYKTRLCPFGLSCRRMGKCTYAHYPSELNDSVCLNKTRLCESFRFSGSCDKLSTCKFAHSPWDLNCTVDLFKRKLCLKEGCVDLTCRHAHFTGEIEQVFKWLSSGELPVSKETVRHIDFFRLVYNYIPCGDVAADALIAKMKSEYKLDQFPPPAWPVTFKMPSIWSPVWYPSPASIPPLNTGVPRAYRAPSQFIDPRYLTPAHPLNPLYHNVPQSTPHFPSFPHHLMDSFSPNSYSATPPTNSGIDPLNLNMMSCRMSK
eukprot:GHVH01005203.1.p1 GENE.GHVH01005203.1~~GHVH01005203.1.p1  ORF type:complete len:306 (+),score=26.74 GHVH01005203.1:199-1116(+)